MNITHLRYVAIATPEFERSKAFFTEAWGLRDGGTAPDGYAFLQTQSDEPFQLALIRGAERKVVRIAFGLPARHSRPTSRRELPDRAGPYRKSWRTSW